ncbi:trehalose permease IIC protein, partial [Brevibacillus sp. SIMBA_076]
AYILSQIEMFLKKRVPNAIQLLVVPITTIVVTGFLALAIVGPITRGIGNVIATGLVNTFEAVPVVGALLFGLFYAPLVV